MYASDKHRDRDREGIDVRVIEYTLTAPGRTGCGEKHRRITTSADEVLDPAADLVVLYHARWEEELAIDELKTHQRERPVLRRRTPAGVVPEIYGRLTAHGLVRRVMTTAATRAGISPHRVSFTGTRKILRCRLAECPPDEPGRAAGYDRLVAEIEDERMPDRRPRINPRVIKKKMSNWPKKRPEHRPKSRPVKRVRDTVKILG